MEVQARRLRPSPSGYGLVLELAVGTAVTIAAVSLLLPTQQRNRPEARAVSPTAV